MFKNIKNTICLLNFKRKHNKEADRLFKEENILTQKYRFANKCSDLEKYWSKDMIKALRDHVNA